MALSIKLYQRFEVTVNGDLVSDGSTTTAQTITADSGDVYDRTFTLADSTLQQIWTDLEIGGTADFDFLWILSDQDTEIQLVCNEYDGVTGGTVAGSDMESGFVIKLLANVPFVLSTDDSRNLGDVNSTMSEANYASEIDSWETNWTADTIDRIEAYQASGSTANLRIVAIT